MESRCAQLRAKRARVEVRLYQGAGARQVRELGAFVRYCVSRIERELGEISRWSVRIVPAGGGFASLIAIHDAGEVLEATGAGLDGPLAAWDALCKLEQSLREARARRGVDRRTEDVNVPSRRVHAIAPTAGQRT
jgi:hypothetical protein